MFCVWVAAPTTRRTCRCSYLWLDDAHPRVLCSASAKVPTRDAAPAVCMPQVYVFHTATLRAVLAANEKIKGLEEQLVRWGVVGRCADVPLPCPAASICTIRYIWQSVCSLLQQVSCQPTQPTYPHTTGPSHDPLPAQAAAQRRRRAGAFMLRVVR